MFNNLTKGTEKQMSYAKDIIAKMEETRQKSMDDLKKNSPEHVAQFEKISNLQDEYYNDFYQEAGKVIEDYKAILEINTMAENRRIMREKLQNFCKNTDEGKQWYKSKINK